MSKPKRNNDSQPRFTMPDPEGVIPAPAKQPEPTGADVETWRRVRELLSSPMRIALQRTVDLLYGDMKDMQLKQSAKQGSALQAVPILDAQHQEWLALGLAGPRKEFLMEAIELAAIVAIGSRRNY